MIYKIFDKKNRLVRHENNGIITTNLFDENDNKIYTSKEINDVLNYHSFEYDNKNRLIRESTNAGSKLYEYNDKRFENLNTQIKHIYFEKDNDLNDIKKINIIQKFYNELGLTSKFIQGDYSWEKTYDNKGNILLYEDSNKNNVHYFYDDKDRLIECIKNYRNYFESKKIEYINDNIIKTTIYTKDVHSEETNIIIKEIDKNGNTIREKFNNENEEIYKYSENNLLTYSYLDEVETFFNEKGFEIKTINHSIDLTIEYIYDLNDNLEEIIYSNGSTTKFEYDYNNNVIKESYSNGNIIEYKNEYLITNDEIVDYFDFDINNELDFK